MAAKKKTGNKPKAKPSEPARIFEAMLPYEPLAVEAGFEKDFLTRREIALGVVQNTQQEANELLAAYLFRVAAGVDGSVGVLAPRNTFTRDALQAAAGALREDCSSCEKGYANYPDRCLDKLIVRHFRGVLAEVQANYEYYCSAPKPTSPHVKLRPYHHLPGIVDFSLAMPDFHWGYGFPIGGVAAFDLEEGVLSPGGVGYDINCGVRLVRTSLDRADVQPKLGARVRLLASGNTNKNDPNDARSVAVAALRSPACREVAR